MLQFGPETTKKLEVAYLGAEFSARRRLNAQILRPMPGEHILDLGCGNGMMTEELARTVGSEGCITGLDQSRDMLEAAKARLADQPGVRLIEAGADAMPLEDQSQDGAVSVQVFEYISDLNAALREVHRVLKPGGRLVIGDMHFDTWAWATDKPDRMQRMMASWDEHLVHRDVSAKITAALPDCGFTLDRVTPLTMSATALHPDGMAQMLLILMSGFAKANAHLPEDEIDEWVAEQVKRAEEGRFFFSLTHFVVSARRNP